MSSFFNTIDDCQSFTNWVWEEMEDLIASDSQKDGDNVEIIMNEIKDYKRVKEHEIKAQSLLYSTNESYSRQVKSQN